MAHSKYRGRAEERVPGVGFKGLGMFQQRSWAKKGFRVYQGLVSRCRFRVFGSEFKTFTLSLGLGCEGLGRCHVLSEVLPFILDWLLAVCIGLLLSEYRNTASQPERYRT